MVSKIGCALCCSMLSCAGFVFLFLIGLLMVTQPQYMKLGKEAGSGPVFGSAFLYGTLFVASTMVYITESKKQQNQSHERFHMHAKAADERKPLLGH